MIKDVPEINFFSKLGSKWPPFLTKRSGTQVAVTQNLVKWKLMVLQPGIGLKIIPRVHILFMIKDVPRNYFFRNLGLKGIFDKRSKKVLRIAACRHSKPCKMESKGARDLKLGLK